MNIPKININMPQEIVDTCASDNDCTCDTCPNTPEKCKLHQDATLWLEVHTD